MKITRNKIMIFGMVITSISYLIWRIFFTIPFGYGWLSLVFAFFLLTVEILGMIEKIIHFHNMYSIEYPQRPIVSEKDFPHVDVFITTYNEPTYLLYKTINGCKSMDYCDKSKVHIYLCDDSARPEVRKLAKDMGINYLSRKDKNGAKAGNLNNALKNTSSPLIVTFDADMIPMHDFLIATVPYFIEDLINAEKIKKEKGAKESKKRKNKIGFVQLPQNFYNYDLFQYNLFSEDRIPNEQDYFYRDIQVSKNKSNSVIYGGSNTVISREALEEIGGFYTKVITEDIATGLLIESKGYKCIALDEVHASGLAPKDLKSLIKQRRRWGRGCIQTSRKLNILFRKGLTWSQKISYISSILYWFNPLKRFIYIMAPILFSVFGVVTVKCTIVEVLIFALPMYIFSRQCLKIISRNIRTVKWTNIYETIFLPILFFDILFETFGISKSKFEVTHKSQVKEDKIYQLKNSIPHIIFLILSIIGIFNCIKMIFIKGVYDYFVLLFWLMINFYNVLMAIFFLLGRKTSRGAERFLVNASCVINSKEILKPIECISYDISETGLSVLLNEAVFIPYDTDVSILLKTDMYISKFIARIIHVDEFNGKWKYAFVIKHINNKNYNNLLNIIHDRVPKMTKTISKNRNIFYDFRANILKRNKDYKTLNRRLPRIDLNKNVETKECGNITILNYNYECLLLKIDCKFSNIKKITIKYGNNKYLTCYLKKKLSNNNKSLENNHYKAVYAISNYKNILFDEEFNLYKT
ncbi:glycosyltransferase [Clostridium sp. HCP1S3_A12]|nr:glycosyltransferase [Clostridiales bacterium]